MPYGFNCGCSRPELYFCVFKYVAVYEYVIQKLDHVFTDNCMYIHGGIDKHGSTAPLDKMYKMDLSEGIWKEVRYASFFSVCKRFLLYIRRLYSTFNLS